MARNDRRHLVIRRSDDSETHDRHGGAWKIAYADFMTAMMSFFLVMWLLNATTDEQRRGIAQFFNPMADKDTHVQPTDSMLDVPPSPLTTGRSVRRVKDGKTSAAPNPAASNQSGPADDISRGAGTLLTARPASIVPIGGPDSGSAQRPGNVGADDAAAEQAGIARMVSGLDQAIRNDGELRGAASNLSVQIGRDDVRIELRDASDTPMFDSGAPAPNRLGTRMLAEIAKWLAPMPERISIIGYTDAAAYRVGGAWRMSNWTLSALRADHAREILVRAGYPDGKILDVSGAADRNPAVPSDPSAAGNRRVVIVMHRRYVSPAGTEGASGAAHMNENGDD
ncbi:flagellar motor protein MotB [Nguyenibacter sp. L1]|uniref:flagellar motor protein MotB n=1 Tax=Nguyenibacter sp. L1 TaxID=3049350 RepID=UPI002B459C20|nr:flagellar motor protein MotB [Nguyenibacter sp. L1]WRH89724.1 flagellar motor protein MotB [Nguyenibacter sp. L1]